MSKKNKYLLQIYVHELHNDIILPLSQDGFLLPTADNLTKEREAHYVV